MEKTIVGRQYISTTTCLLEEDGNWKATNVIKDMALYQGEGNWTEAEISAMVYDSDPQKAIQAAMSSTLNYLVSNVYQKGFLGLIEYRTFEKEQEEANGSKAESN